MRNWILPGLSGDVQPSRAMPMEASWNLHREFPHGGLCVPQARGGPGQPTPRKRSEGDVRERHPLESFSQTGLLLGRKLPRSGSVVIAGRFGLRTRLDGEQRRLVGNEQRVVGHDGRAVDRVAHIDFGNGLVIRHGFGGIG